MKTLKLIFCLFGCLLSLAMLAADKDSQAVTMVSYEQGWSDYKGTIALRNNTTTDIHNVKFIITYLDMSGEQLDYEEYFVNVDIAPGKTKKVDIPAYEHERDYSYYKSEARSSNPHRFKIRYELKDYNIQHPSKSVNKSSILDEYDEDFDVIQQQKNVGMYMLFAIIVGVIIIGISVGLYVLVAVMAKKRNRNVVLWVLLSLIGTPLLMIIILACIGNADDYNKDFV